MAGADELRGEVAAIEAVDQHAHLLSGPGREPGLAEVLTESDDPAQIEQVVEHPAFHRALIDLAAALGVEPSVESIVAARLEEGFEEFTGRVLAGCRLAEVLVDDGYRIPGAIGLEQFASLLRRPVGRIVRIESVAEQAAEGWPTFPEVVDRFGAGLAAAVAGGAKALKTVAAYRCGLDLRPGVDRHVAAAAYDEWRRRDDSSRLIERDLISFFVLETLERTAEARLPLQVHTGFGDRDLALHLADPSRLRPLLEHPLGRDVPVVLLHCYPFVAQASWLAGVYPNVSLDLSLAMTFLVHQGPALVLEALGLAPATKLLFATDATRLPEAFLLATIWWRESLVRALGELVDEGMIGLRTGRRWAHLVLADNARRIYG